MVSMRKIIGGLLLTLGLVACGTQPYVEKQEAVLADINWEDYYRNRGWVVIINDTNRVLKKVRLQGLVVPDKEDEPYTEEEGDITFSTIKELTLYPAGRPSIHVNPENYYRVKYPGPSGDEFALHYYVERGETVEFRLTHETVSFP